MRVVWGALTMTGYLMLDSWYVYIYRVSYLFLQQYYAQTLNYNYMYLHSITIITIKTKYFVLRQYDCAERLLRLHEDQKLLTNLNWTNEKRRHNSLH